MMSRICSVWPTWIRCVILCVSLASPAALAVPPTVGQIAPALVARSFDGRTVDLKSLRGKVVVLNFWASWCGPCRAEMPLLDSLSREYHDRGVMVVGLSADDPHDRKDALKAAAAVGYLTGLLSEAPINSFGEPPVLPMTYVIGPDGTVGAVLTANRGALSAAQLHAAVDVLVRATEPAAKAQRL